MRVYKRPDSKYWWIRDGDTRIPGNRKATPFLRSQYTKTQVQSIIYENGMKTFLKALGAEVKYKTLRQVKVQYDKEINSLHANSSSHCKAIKTYVNGFIDFVGKDESIAEITTKTIEAYLVKRIKDGIALSTVQKDKTYINQYFEMAESSNYIEKNKNPAKRIRKGLIPKITRSNQNRINDPIPDKFFFPILEDNSIAQYERLFWKIMRYTGFDPGNALTLENHNINIQEKLIYCERDKNKNPTSPIPIHSSLIHEDIINLKEQFPQKTIKAILRYSLKNMRSALVSVGYDKYVNFKCIRHSFNQSLVREGVEDTMRMKVMGQTNIKSQQTYTRSDQEGLRAAIENIASEIGRDL